MSEDIDKHVIRKYEIGCKVGKGAYGVVWYVDTYRQVYSTQLQCNAIYFYIIQHILLLKTISDNTMQMR